MIALCLTFLSQAAFAATFVPKDPVLPLSAVKPGMTGYARTVLSGTKISAFKVTILGVVPRKTKPKNLILIRVDDSGIRKGGGIAEGMSGSPVYVGGKLIGAIGYGWAFSDSNLGLVTPIEEMIAVMENSDKIPWFDIPQALDKPAVKAVSGDVSSQDVSSADALSADSAVLSADTAAAEETASGDLVISGDIFRKKQLPLIVDGISDRMAVRLGQKLGVKVISFGSGSSAGGHTNLSWKPEPGAAMGAALAWGDFVAGGIGTLSSVSKDGRFLAFAHPMFNKGSVAYALMDANIVKVIPSLESSFKLGYLNRVAGIVTQDRPEAIGGKLGQLAAASSCTVKFRNVDSGEKAVKRFQTVSDPFIGPEVRTAGILGLVDDLWAQKGEGTALVSYSVSGGNLRPAWTRRDIFYSDKDIVKALQKEIDGMGKIISLNPFRAISPLGVTVEVELTKKPRVVFIDKIEIPDKKESYKPGEKFVVNVTCRPWRKAPIIKNFELTVPENAMAFCEVTARGGGIEEPMQEAIKTGVRALTNFDELLTELAVKETNNQLIVELSGPEKDSKKKKQKAENDRSGEKKAADAKDGKNKKAETGRAKEPSKPAGELLTPGDLLEDRLLSEVREEKIKDGALVIADTNYYIEGVLHTFIRIKSGAKAGAVEETELTDLLEKGGGETEELSEEEQSPDELPSGDENDGGDDGDEGEDDFAVLSRTIRPR